MRKDHTNEYRRWVVAAILLAIAAVYFVRLFALQIGDSSYKESADSNAFLKKTIYPSRGLMYDRNGELIVYNMPAYDVMIIPKDVADFDTVDFCNTLNITREQLLQRIADMKDTHKNPSYSAYSPQVLIPHLSPRDYGRLQEKLYRFSGFFIQQRILRQYNTHAGGNLLGDLREVSQTDIDGDDYYSAGDYMGDLGIERSYEKYLRGQKGLEIIIRDALGRLHGKYDQGRHDIPPVSGRDLKLSIDIKLQEYAESLMVGKRGAIVAIEPKTGEILCLVSSPSFDPALLVGKDRGKNYSGLFKDPSKPLYDRALMAAYPPGSTFKPTQGLVLLQEGIVSLGTSYPCNHGYISGRLRVGCHGHASPIALKPALETSCNSYFCWGFRSMIDRRGKYGSPDRAFEVWKNHLVSMGYGYRLGIDMPAEGRGFLPNAKFYDKRYGEGDWTANTIISVAIGQGEVLATPLQIANLCATIANRGWFVTPHVVKSIQDNPLPAELLKKRRPTIALSHYPDIAEGMRMAVLGGTCKRAAFGDIEVAGKTGTAQNPHGRDHSAFMGFAPFNDPKIAVAVYVENGGFGATFGVPIGSLVMEKYLTGTTTRKPLQDQMRSTKISYSESSTKDRASDKKTDKKTSKKASDTSQTPSEDGEKAPSANDGPAAVETRPTQAADTARH